MTKKIEMTPAQYWMLSQDGTYVINQDLRVRYMNSDMIADFGDGIGKKCYQLVNQTEDKCP